MAGKKGMKGGGGARAGSGPKARRLQLPKGASQELNILLLHRRALTGNQELQAIDVVVQLIHEKWLEYDTVIQEATEDNPCTSF